MEKAIHVCGFFYLFIIIILCVCVYNGVRCGSKSRIVGKVCGPCVVFTQIK